MVNPSLTISNYEDYFALKICRMNKKEKKEIITKLMHEIDQTSELDEYAAKRSQLFQEVINAGYPAESLAAVVLATDTWCKDFDKNMEARISKKKPPLCKQFIELSKVGLLTIIDTSLLPD